MKKSKCCNTKAIKQDVGNYFCSNCTSICKTRKTYSKTVFLLIFSALFCVSLQSFAPNSKIGYTTEFTVNKNKFELTDSGILKELIKNNSYFPEVSLRQAKQECGVNFNSRIAGENKNLFGMKCNCKLSKGFKNGHSSYKSYEDCIKCHVQFSNRYWDKYFKNYAEDSLYIQKIIKL